MAKAEKPIRIFVASSKESLPIANAIHSVLDDFAEVTVWPQNVFRPSKGSIKALFNFIDKKTDFAIIVYSPDDTAQVRDEEVRMARDNVIFELGLCVGRLGMERTFIFKPKGIDGFALPSDLSGITCVPYKSNRTDENLEATVNPGCNTIKKEISELSHEIKTEEEIKVNTSIKSEDSLSKSKFKMVHPNGKIDEFTSLDLEENDKKIIKFLGDRGDGYYPVSILMTLLNGKRTITEHHLDVLDENGLILTRYTAGVENQHNLSPLGRKYYVKKILEN